MGFSSVKGMSSLKKAIQDKKSKQYDIFNSKAISIPGMVYEREVV
jgi:hypothetical protein